MMEQRKENIRKKLDGYEANSIPNGLWEEIDSALGSEKKEKRSKIVVMRGLKWASVAAVLIAIVTITMVVHDKNTDQLVAENEKIIDKAHKTSLEHVGNITSVVGGTPILAMVGGRDNDNIPNSNDEADTERETCAMNEMNECDNIQKVDEDSSEKEDSKTQEMQSSSNTNHNIRKQDIMHNASIAKPRSIQRLYLTLSGSGLNMTSVSLGAIENHGGIYADPSYTESSGSASQYSNCVVNSEKHSRPISLGVMVGVPMDDRWSLKTGLTYTLLKSEFDKGTTLSYQHSKQRLHYVGVPVMMSYRVIGNGNVSLSVGAGGRVEFGIKGTVEKEDVISGTNMGAKRESLNDIPINAALMLSPTLEVKLLKGVNLYAEPSLRYNIAPSEKYKNYYTSHAWMVELNLGTRIGF